MIRTTPTLSILLISETIISRCFGLIRWQGSLNGSPSVGMRHSCLQFTSIFMPFERNERLCCLMTSARSSAFLMRSIFFSTSYKFYFIIVPNGRREIRVLVFVALAFVMCMGVWFVLVIFCPYLVVFSTFDEADVVVSSVCWCHFRRAV